MAAVLKLCFVILLSCAYVHADVAHLGYSRYRGQRGQSLRLQRLESGPTPYPAAGYRPNREFNLPRDQPLFPLSNHQSSSGFDNLSEPQRPQVIYGSPAQQPRFPQQNRPQNGFNNGFSNFDESQHIDVNNGFDNFNEPQQPENSNRFFSNGFNNLAEPQQPEQSPELLYGAPNNQEQEPESGVDNLSEPQYKYKAPAARLRQQPLAARFQQAQRLQQFQQPEAQGYRQSQYQSQKLQFFNPQQQQQALSESKNSRLIAHKPARLTDNREETEVESDAKTSETVEDIETTTKAESKKTAVNQIPATPVVANTGLVNYYPAGAFSFVQPFSGAYVASANYPAVQPVTAAYTIGSPFLPQQYALAAGAPAQLQAW